MKTKLKNINFKNFKDVNSFRENPVVSYYNDDSICSRLKDIEWNFVAQIKPGIGKDTKVTFKNIPDYNRLEVQRTIFKIYRKFTTSIPTLQMLINNIQIIVSCLGSTDWSLLDQDKSYRQFKKTLKSKKYSTSVIYQILSCLRKMHDVGVISRYEKNTKGKFTKELPCSTKQVKKQHIAIPESMSSKLFKTAMNIVDKYHPYRHEISAIHAKAIRVQKEVFSDIVNRKKVTHSALQQRVRNGVKKIEHNVPDFNVSLLFEDILEVQTACLIVVQAFSGARLGESVSFDKSSYHTTPLSDEFDIPLLLGEVTKVNEKGVPTREAWVTHPISKKAIELAYDMSEYAREIYKDIIENYNKDEKEAAERDIKTAFITLGVISQKTKFIQKKGLARRYLKFQRKYNIYATQSDVDEFNLLNPTRKNSLELGGLLPKLSPHDFRRTFAVFLVRNKLGNLMTLKHQYKHLNIAMSAWYANHSQLAAQMDFELDDDLQDLVKASNEDLHTDILFHIFNESETLSGKEGERIARERDDYAGEIYMSRDEIHKQIKNGNLSIVEHPTGFCTNPSCDRICASETSTATCQHEIVTLEKAKSRIPVRNRLITRFNALNDDRIYMASILSKIYTQIKAIEITLEKHKLDFIPFEAVIKSQTLLIAREKL